MDSKLPQLLEIYGAATLVRVETALWSDALPKGSVLALGELIALLVATGAPLAGFQPRLHYLDVDANDPICWEPIVSGSRTAVRLVGLPGDPTSTRRRFRDWI